MAMAQKGVVDVLDPDARPFEPHQKAVASAAVHQHGLLAVVQDATGIVTPHGSGIAGPQNNEPFHDSPPERLAGPVTRAPPRTVPA